MSKTKKPYGLQPGEVVRLVRLLKYEGGDIVECDDEGDWLPEGVEIGAVGVIEAIHDASDESIRDGHTAHVVRFFLNPAEPKSFYRRELRRV